MIITDSNIWMDFFKEIENEETKELDYILKNRIKVGINSIIVIEVLQGILDDKEYQKVRSFLSKFKLFKINHNTIIKAGAIFRTCQKGIKTRDGVIKGKTLKTTDCIIASQCIETDLPIFARDKHFKIMQEFFPQLKIYYKH